MQYFELLLYYLFSRIWPKVSSLKVNKVKGKEKKRKEEISHQVSSAAAAATTTKNEAVRMWTMSEN